MGGKTGQAGGGWDGEKFMAGLGVGERFEQVVTFDEAGARAFAALVGDFNPAHHDEDFASKGRFGGLIISGTQSTGMMMAMTATYLAGKGTALGLDYSFKFRKAVRMGESVTMAWEVTHVTAKPGLGDIIDMTGTLTVHSTGEVAVTGTGKAVLLADQAAE